MHALPPILNVATRQSPMALAQTTQVMAALQAHTPNSVFQAYPLSSEGCYEKYQGDIAALGGKGAFTKTLSLALLAGDAHLAMHSAKDMPTDETLPEGLVLAGCLPRANPADCLVLPQGATLKSLADLPKTARIGTSSPRRAAQLHALGFTDITPIRGNANTRLEKVDKGDYDAAVLAVSGLERLGLAQRIGYVFTPTEMLPAAGQGIVAIEAHTGNAALLDVITQATQTTPEGQATWQCLLAERACLQTLGGGCHSAIAAHAHQLSDGTLHMVAKVFTQDGASLSAEGEGTDSEALGAQAAELLLSQGAKNLL